MVAAKKIFFRLLFGHCSITEGINSSIINQIEFQGYTFVTYLPFRKLHRGS